MSTGSAHLASFLTRQGADSCKVRVLCGRTAGGREGERPGQGASSGGRQGGSASEPRCSPPASSEGGVERHPLMQAIK